MIQLVKAAARTDAMGVILNVIRDVKACARVVVPLVKIHVTQHVLEVVRGHVVKLVRQLVERVVITLVF